MEYLEREISVTLCANNSRPEPRVSFFVEAAENDLKRD